MGPDALRKLVAGHRELLAFLEKRVGDRAVAEDILQEAFVRGLARGELRADDRAVAWFYRVLRNALADHWRRRAAATRAEEAARAELGAERHDDELERVVCACVARLLPTLKPEYAEILRRVELDGIAVKAAAEVLGITATNAGVRIHRARAALRRRVEEVCRACATHGCLDCACGST